jgi:hypothetical protein
MLPLALAGAFAASVYAFISRLWPSPAAATYCYPSLQSISERPVYVTCFDISASGTFTNVFSHVIDDVDKVREGYIIPGLWDGHGHLLLYGELLHSVNVFGATSLDEVRARVVDYANEHPEAGSKSEWIRGVGWDQAAYGRMPTAVGSNPRPVFEVKRCLISLYFFHKLCAIGKCCNNLLTRPRQTSKRLQG